MNLVIDAGNTQIKFAVFRRNRLLHVETSPEAGFSDHIKALFDGDRVPNLTGQFRKVLRDRLLDINLPFMFE